MVTPLAPMANPSQIDQITERVDRLLVRYEELQRTNALLAQQVTALTSERDSLRSRLNAARSRVDALLDCIATKVHPLVLDGQPVAGLRYDRVTGRYLEPQRDAEGRVYEFSFGGRS